MDLFLFQVFLGTSALIVMVKTFSRFPDTTFKLFTFLLSSLAFTSTVIVENELGKVVFLLLGVMTLFAGFATLFARE